METVRFFLKHYPAGAAFQFTAVRGHPYQHLHSFSMEVRLEAHAAAAAACCLQRDPAAKGLNYAGAGTMYLLFCAELPACALCSHQDGAVWCRKVLDLVRSWRRGMGTEQGAEHSAAGAVDDGDAVRKQQAAIAVWR
jgi:hypothetical protein